MKKKLLYILPGIAFSLFIGIAIGSNSSIYSLIILGIGFLSTLGLFLLTLLIDLQIKSRSRVLGGAIFIAGFISLVSGFLAFKVATNHKHKEAVHLVTEIENYREKKGHYPSSLSLLPGKIDRSKFYYGINPTQQSYHLSYVQDGWNVKRYSSKTRQWTISD